MRRADSRNIESVVAAVFRAGSAIVAAILLIVLFPRISGVGSAAIYAATWITLLHLCIGEYVLIRYLHARSRVQHALDALAAVFALAAVLSFRSTALWCAFFGAVSAIAVVKYLLVERSARPDALRLYARGKLIWESPAVVGFAALAVVLDQLPAGSTAATAIEIGLLCAMAFFAVWMIGIRHVYRSVARQARAQEKNDNGATEG